MSQKIILVSACLLNIPCQYNGQLAKKRLNQREFEKIEGHLVPVCPEQLSGLSTPRKPVEIQGGDGFDVLERHAHVISEDGEDFTEQFIKGASLVLDIANVLGATHMITQFRSPSCSSDKIYDGSFHHHLKQGFGICAALLKSHHIELIDIDKFRMM